MYPYFRALLFRLDPETAHGLTLNLLRLAGSIPPARWLLQAMYAVPDQPVNAFGLTFKNPIGLAAGYDKDGVAVRGLAGLGFGHIEVGTVTPLPQPGNPRPRIFRLVEDRAVINRMGFPGRGAEFVARKLGAERRPSSIILGVNLGKNKGTPLEEAARDYISLLSIFTPLADYLTINISSPNTVGLRRLQGRQMLSNLLVAIKKHRLTLPRQIPLLVKLSPDLDQ
ncbi:MAG: quinone-dependent dihydroorotate dehydrogenase, partial [Chloroflexota bacterium]